MAEHSGGDLPIVFESTGEEFSALIAARAEIERRGWSVGRNQRSDPRGVIFEPGRDIAKWRNLSLDERAACDACLVGSGRSGPLILTKEQPQ